MLLHAVAFYSVALGGCCCSGCCSLKCRQNYVVMFLRDGHAFLNAFAVRVPGFFLRVPEFPRPRVPV